MNIVVVFLLTLGCSLSASYPAVDTHLGDANRIVNGQAIDIGQIPYHAALRRKSSLGWTYTCGAAIITTRDLITAAHCVSTIQTNPSQLRVAVGSSYRSSGGQVYDVETIYVHEKYSSLTLENDIAMLVTAKKMSFDDNVGTVFIPDADYALSVGTVALVSGYGAISYEGSTSAVLRAATVEIVAQDVCTRAYRQIAKIYEGMMCAFSNNPPRDACQGDSGGPLVTQGMLVGIVSWGEGCANISYPGVYTRVSQYNSWIINKLVLI